MTHGGIINAKVKIEERSKIGQRDPIFSPMVWKKSTRIQAYQVYLNFNLILIDLVMRKHSFYLKVFRFQF